MSSHRLTIYHLMLFITLVCLTTGGVSVGMALATHYIQDLKAQANQCQAK